MMKLVCGRLRVLLVDDEPEILKAISWELEDVADVTATPSVAEALAAVAAGPFDVVIADLRLPDRWGDELLAYVAARTPATRRVLLTADSDPEHTVRELIAHGVIEATYQKPHVGRLLEDVRAWAKAASERPDPPEDGAPRTVLAPIGSNRA
jgi:DNA-binding NtrC family response regulator